MATTAKKPRRTPLEESNSKVVEIFKANGSLELEVRLLKDQLNEARRNHQEAQKALEYLRLAHNDTSVEKARLEGYVDRVREEDRNKLEELVGRA